MNGKFTGIAASLIAGLMLAAIIAAWNVNGSLRALEATVSGFDDKLEKVDKRLTWLERAGVR